MMVSSNVRPQVKCDFNGNISIKKLKLLFSEGLALRHSLKRAQIVLTLSFLGVLLIDVAVEQIWNLSVWSSVVLIGSITPFVYFVIGRLLRPTKRTLHAQNLFVSNAAHELRGSLSNMLFSTETQLLDAESSNTISNSRANTDALIQNLHKDLRGLQNMANIIHNLSTIASYEHRAGGMNQDPVDLSGLLKRISEEIATTTADAKDIRIKLAMSEPSSHILSNESALEQMIRNLLSNAVKYSPERSTICASITESEKLVTLSIKDTGIGISEDDMTKVFDPFFRSDAIAARKEEGSGLGLAIVREVVREHRAKLFIKSVLGKGTEISVNLPALPRWYTAST